MLRSRSFNRQPMPERQPLVWPGVQKFATSPRVDMGIHIAQPKTEVVRSEAYRRLVAAMPCKVCGIEGYSQAAHLPPEGKGVKQDDRLLFALCCTRVGVPGCHADYDQYRLFNHENAMIFGMAWAVETMHEIQAAGAWPVKLPRFIYNTGEDI